MPVVATARAPMNVVKYANLLVIRSVLSHYQTTLLVNGHNLAVACREGIRPASALKAHATMAVDRNLQVWAGRTGCARISARPVMPGCYAVAVEGIFSSFVRFPLRIWIFWSLVNVEWLTIISTGTGQLSGLSVP